MRRYKQEIRRVLINLREIWDKENDEEFKIDIEHFSNLDYAICMAVVHQVYLVGWLDVYGEPVELDLRPLEKAAIRNGGVPPFTFESLIYNLSVILYNCNQIPWPRWEAVYKYFDMLVEADKVLDEEENEYEDDYDDMYDEEYDNED